MKLRMVLSVAIVALCVSSAGAQASFRDGHGDGQRRAVLEKEFRARGEQLVRERLNLSPDQLSRLRDVNSRLDGQRHALVEQERTTRVALRQELARGSAADQSRVAELMAQSSDLQQQRFQLQQEEQKELSTFLTPVQLAQYFGLQAQLRQKMQQMRQEQSQEQSQQQSQGEPAPTP